MIADMPRLGWFVATLLIACGCSPRVRGNEPAAPVAPAAAPVAEPAAVPPAHMPAYQGGYRLPVVGRWRVHHVHYNRKDDQRFAVDLIKDAGNLVAEGNARYPSWSQPIVADGPGIVVFAIDGHPDNRPPKKNRYDMHGNFVVIDHKNGEYSLFAHLMKGTVRVRVGQAVQMGQELGLCGNSGNTTMPHLHYQVMNHPYAHLAKGLPVRHIGYLNNGRMSTQQMAKGDRIEIAPGTP